MMPLAVAVLLASLIGSPHCAGMCGGFVAFYAGDSRSRIRPHLAYSFGRLLSYAALGAIAGAIGAGVDHVGALAGLGRIAALAAGLAMIAWGGVSLLATLGWPVGRPAAPAALRQWLAAALRAVGRQPDWVRGWVMGLVTTLIPCGWLYAYVAVAGGTARPIAGATVMAAFWVGTLPVMAGLGLAAQSALGPLRRRLPALTATLLLLFGLLTVANRLRPMPAMDHMAPGFLSPHSGPGHVARPGR